MHLPETVNSEILDLSDSLFFSEHWKLNVDSQKNKKTAAKN